MQTFKIFQAASHDQLEAQVNSYAKGKDLKIVDFKYNHAVEINGCSLYSAGVLFEPVDVDAVTAREAQRKKEFYRMAGDRITRNGGVIVRIQGATGTGKQLIADMLSDFAANCAVSFEHEALVRDLASIGSTPVEVIRIGIKDKNR